MNLGYHLTLLPRCCKWDTEAQSGEGICTGTHSEFRLSEISLVGGAFSKKCSNNLAYSGPVLATLAHILQGPCPAGHFCWSVDQLTCDFLARPPQWKP